MTQESSPIEALIMDPYRKIYDYAKREHLFENEQAMQSAVASMYIRYNQLADKNPNFNGLVKAMTEEAKSKTYVHEYNSIIKHIYAPLMATSVKARMYIDNKTKTPITDFFKFEEDLREYMERNHMKFEICFNVSIIEDEENVSAPN